MTKAEKVTNFITLWVARLSLAVLAVAGLIDLLGGVDLTIAYIVAPVSVAFLLKEVL